MSYRHYPNSNRIIDRDRIYLDDYVNQTRKDSDILIGSVGDSIKLLKDYKVPTHEIDHKGDTKPRGSHGGRRQLQPKVIPDPTNISANGGEIVNRPKKENFILLPAILDLNPTDETRAMYGFRDTDYGTVTMAVKYLDDRNIKIDTACDYFGIKGEVF